MVPVAVGHHVQRTYKVGASVPTVTPGQERYYLVQTLSFSICPSVPHDQTWPGRSRCTAVVVER